MPGKTNSSCLGKGPLSNTHCELCLSVLTEHVQYNKHCTVYLCGLGSHLDHTADEVLMPIPMSSQAQLPIAAATRLGNDKPAPRSTAWNAHATHTHIHTYIEEFLVVHTCFRVNHFPPSTEKEKVSRVQGRTCLNTIEQDWDTGLTIAHLPSK